MLEFAGLGGSGGRIETGAGEIENAGEGEIVANDVGEESGVGFGVVGFWNEVGDGDAGFFDAEAGAGAEPVLSEMGEERKEDRRQGEERSEEFGFRGQGSLRVLSAKGRIVNFAGSRLRQKMANSRGKK